MAYYLGTNEQYTIRPYKCIVVKTEPQNTKSLKLAGRTRAWRYQRHNQNP